MLNVKITLWYGLDDELELKKENDFQVLEPITEIRTNGDTLENLHFRAITSRKEPISPFTRAEVEINGIKSYWLASSVSSKSNNNNYIHDFFLIEPRKELERYILDERTFSKGSNYFNTNSNLLIHIKNTCFPLRNGERNPLYNLFFNEEPYTNFLDKEAEEYFFSQQTTFYEAIEAVGKTGQLKPRMRTFDRIIFEKTTPNYDDVYDMDNNLRIEETNSRDLDFYSNVLESRLNNVIDPDAKMFFLNNQTGISMRSETIRVEPNNARIILEKPIYKIKRVAISAIDNPLIVYIEKKDGSFVNNAKISRELDITEFVLEKQEYEMLENDDGTPLKIGTQLCSLYYETNKNYISGVFDYNDFWLARSGVAIQNVIREALKRADWNYIFSYWLGGPETNIDPNDIKKIENIGPLSNTNIMKMSFIVEYVAIDEIRVKNYRNRYEDVNLYYLKTGFNPNSLLYNQQANIVDFNYFTKNLKQVHDKLGKEESVIKFINKDFNLPKVNQRIEDNFINEVKIEYYKTFNKVEVRTSKGGNLIEGRSEVESQIRLFSIPNDEFVSNRIIHKDTFCFIDSEYTDNSSDLNKEAKTRIIKTITNYKPLNTHYTPLAIISFLEYNKDTKVYETKELLKPINYFSGSSYNLLSFGFNDNSIAGFTKEKGKEKGQRKAVRYTNDEGELDKISVDIKTVSYLSGFEPDNYPINSISDYQKELLSFDIDNLKKDRREIINFNYQINYLSDNEKIIIGDYFSRFTNLNEKEKGDIVFFAGVSTIKFTPYNLHQSSGASNMVNGEVNLGLGAKIRIKHDYSNNNAGYGVNNYLNIEYENLENLHYFEELQSLIILVMIGTEKFPLLAINDLSINKLYFNFTNDYYKG